MSAGYTLVKAIPSPFTTLSGKTRGPAVSLGRFRGKPGGPLWIHFDELRSVVAAAGWPLPEQHARVRDELASASASLGRVTAERDGLLEENAKLRAALTVVKPAKAKPAQEVAA